jgi:hypothetical protein
MATEQGRALVRNLIEYPLPARSGVRDYVFYLAPMDDYGYGWASRRFFGDFYKTHQKHDAHSLEGVIDTLHAEVTQGGIQHIRELIIVAHANSQALLFRVLEDAQAGEPLPYVNGLTLGRLRKRFLDQDPGVQAFKAKRDVVLTHLHDDSWVTIRACNFGNSVSGIYATYAFFGGHADLYAPRLFMHFGEYSIDPAFARLSSPAKFHDHLVRQHFLPRDRTRQRAEDEVRELYEPPLFSAPHELVSVPLTGPTPEQTSDFDAVVNALDGRTLSEPLVSALTEMMATLSITGWAPTPAAKLAVIRKGAAWTLRDQLAHEGIAYYLTFKIDIGKDAASRTVRAQAQISTFERTKIPQGGLVMLQLFLRTDEDDIIHGRLLQLAGYALKGDTQENQRRFDAAIALLKAGKLTDPAQPGVDLKHDIETGLEVTLAQPQLTRVSPAEWPQDGAFVRAEWDLQDGANRWRIKLENPATPTGVQAYRITLYAAATPKELYLHEMAYLADHVDNADTPGTELAAYFDRLTIEELLSVVEFLRSPFKPGHSLYIAHAQLAMKRKRGFEQWLFNRHPELVQPYGTPVIFEDEWELTHSEALDKAETSYEFDFAGTWSAVKSMYPAHIPFQSDLFLEEDFAAHFEIDLDDPVEDLETDAAPIDLSDPDAFAAPFRTHPSVTDDKGLFDEPDPTAGCKDFEAAITQAMQVKDLPPVQIEGLLDTQQTADGETYFDVAKAVAKKYSFVRSMANWVEFPYADKLLPAPTSPDSVATESLKILLKQRVKSEIGWWAASEGALAADTALLQTGLGVLWAWGIVKEPLKMLLRIAEAEADTDEKWEAIGYVTALRQWLREAASLTYHADGLPDLHTIHVDTPVGGEYAFANEPYYIGRYFLEQYQQSGGYSAFIWPGDALQRGFDRGVIAATFTVAGDLERRSRHGVDVLLDRWGLDSCKIRVLIDAGVLDLGSLQSEVISEMADAMRERLPHP